MGRDLLYKPQVPIILDDQDDTKKVDGKKKGQEAQKKPTSLKDLGQIGEDPILKAAAQRALKAQGLEKTQKKPRAQEPQKTGKAHKAAYFNKDTSAVRAANQNASGMKALRGSQEAMDLRKIVLPSSGMVETPEPENLKGAMDLMGLENGFENDMAGLLGRQNSWLQAKGVTKEMIEERLRELDRMVEDRKIALARMAKRNNGRPLTSPTIAQAVSAGGAALEQTDDVAAAGKELIGQTSAQAHGMHKRIAKIFGKKI